MELLEDKEIYAVVPENMAYPDCIYCLCRLCMFLRSHCRLCYYCELSPKLRHSCRWFVPFVFGKSPYFEYYRELEQLRVARYDFSKPIL